MVSKNNRKSKKKNSFKKKKLLTGGAAKVCLAENEKLTGENNVLKENNKILTANNNILRKDNNVLKMDYTLLQLNCGGQNCEGTLPDGWTAYRDNNNEINYVFKTEDGQFITTRQLPRHIEDDHWELDL